MPLKKPSHLFQEEKVLIREDYNPIVETFNETFDKFKGNVSLIEDIKQKVDILTEEIGDKITKSDLETAMFSHLLMVDENIKNIQSRVRGLNKNDLLEFKSTSAHLIEIVDDLKTNQFPKYKRKILDTEVKISENFNQFKEEVGIIQINAEQELQEKLDNFANVVDNNFSIFNENIQKTKEYVNETVETYRKLYKIVESKTEKENEKFEEYSSILQNFNEEFISFQESIQTQIKQYETINNVLDERFESFGNDLVKWEDNVKNNIEDYKKETSDSILEFKTDISSLKADIVVFEKHNKSLLTKVDSLQENIGEFQQDLTDNIVVIETVGNAQEELKENLTETQKNLEVVERYIQNHYNDIEVLKEEVYTEIKKLPVGNLQENIERLENKIDYIRETYSKIEPEVIVNQVIKESFNEPPSTKNSDPLTPLDQNFVTLDQLQQHYRLFINRIQQQISTLGGGGETRLKYLDDIVGIATNASSYDGKYLKYNHSLGKFEFTSVDITNDSWEDGITGPHTNGNVGIGTSVANCKLDVVGNVCVSGVVTSTSLNISSTEVISSSRQLKNITSLDATTTATIESAISNAPNTFTDLNVTGITTLNVVRANSLSVVGVLTAGGFDGGPLSGSSGSFTQINVTGVTTSTTFNSTTGTITNLSGTNINYTGIGTITTLNSNTGTVTNLSGTNINTSGVTTTTTLNIGADVGISTTRTSVATISATTIDSFSSTIFRSARVQVQITQGTNYQASDVLIIHDGLIADVIEYGSIATNDYLGTFSGVVSGGNCLLRINMNSATSATVKVLSQRITV